MVFLEGYFVTKAMSYTMQQTTLFTLPAGAAPSDNRFFTCTGGSPAFVVRINGNGQAQFNSNPTFSAKTYLFFTASYHI